MFAMTKQEMEAVMAKGMKKLLRVAGNSSHLALMLGENDMTVHGWGHRSRISKAGALKVAEHPVLSKHITLEELRPDVAHKLEMEKNANKANATEG